MLPSSPIPLSPDDGSLQTRNWATRSDGISEKRPADEDARRFLTPAREPVLPGRQAGMSGDRRLPLDGLALPARNGYLHGMGSIASSGARLRLQGWTGDLPVKWQSLHTAGGPSGIAGP